jgi:hypothetical protein
MSPCHTAQAVSCWLSTVVAGVQPQACSCGTHGGQRGTGAGFLYILWFPLPVLNPPNAPCWSTIWVCYNRPTYLVTQSHPTVWDKNEFQQIDMNVNMQHHHFPSQIKQLCLFICKYILKSDMRRNWSYDETSCIIQYQSHANCTLWKTAER